MPWQIDPTPGARAARRRTFASRPGQADYAEMQLLDLADQIRLNPFIKDKFGPEVQITVSADDTGDVILFKVARAP